MSGGGSSQPSNTTSTTTSSPWQGAAQFLTNSNSSFNPSTGNYDPKGSSASGPMGLYERASNFANNFGQLNQQQQGYLDNYSSQIDSTRPGQMNATYQAGSNVANDLLNGGYNTNYGPVADVNAQGAMRSLGRNDPSNALSQILQGNPSNNPYLAGMNQANINQSMQAYNDALQNAAQVTLPGIAEDAFASGGYGGSRQGIAEGMVGQQLARNARNLSQSAMDYGNQLYGNAFNNAQNNQVSTANSLAGNALQNGQFNANLGLQNNTQQMQQTAQNAQNAQTGYNALNSANGNLWNAQDSLYASQMSNAQAPQTQAMNAMNALAGVITPGAGLGGSSTVSTPIYNNTMGNVMGGASGLLGMLSMLKG